MDIDRLINIWVERFNEHYTNYLFSEQEPRYYVKIFFLYSYNLFNRLGREWNEYIEKYSELFRRDPSNDYYGSRNPCEPNDSEARKNSLEWGTIFEIVNKIGFPYNDSAKTKLLANAKKYLSQAKQSPEVNFHDIMLCSAVENLPDYFEEIREWIPTWISSHIQTYETSVHQLIAYLNALKNIPHTDDIKTELINRISSWVVSPTETPRRQILIWARLATRLEWTGIFPNSEAQPKLKTNFFQNLNSVHDLDWANRPIILEAAYKLSDSEGRESIKNEIARQITPSRFFKFKEIFPFLNERDELSELQSEVEEIGEKCQSSPSIELCKRCMSDPQGRCWIRILAKVTGVTPWTHGPFEVADVVIYTFDQGIYFVIKANPITRQRGEGDVLYRQCTELFSNDHALVIYWNTHDTAPTVIERIREAAASMRTNPRFEIIDKKYIRQIHRQYREVIERGALPP